MEEPILGKPQVAQKKNWVETSPDDVEAVGKGEKRAAEAPARWSLE